MLIVSSRRPDRNGRTWIRLCFLAGPRIAAGRSPKTDNSVCPELLPACDVVLELEVRVDIRGELGYECLDRLEGVFQVRECRECR
jgi:hypothetical protein